MVAETIFLFLYCFSFVIYVWYVAVNIFYDSSLKVVFIIFYLRINFFFFFFCCIMLLVLCSVKFQFNCAICLILLIDRVCLLRLVIVIKLIMSYSILKLFLVVFQIFCGRLKSSGIIWPRDAILSNSLTYSCVCCIYQHSYLE